MVNFFDLLTYPVILLGLFRGSFQTYKSLDEPNDENKKQQLEYWVVMSALLFIFPWVDCVLGLFLFSGVVGVAKLMLLIMVVVSRSNYGFVYKLIEEQFLGFLQPYVEKALEQSEGYRIAFCDNSAFFSLSLVQYYIHLVASSMSDNQLTKLRKRMNKTVERINRELKQRENRETGKEDVVDAVFSLDSRKNNGQKSIFEQASENDGGWSQPIGATGLRKRKNAKDPNKNTNTSTVSTEL